ncbi:hypothetical protein [Maribellus sp. YY47]|uniref:hypothetical protein n=1 Tax=Maribellus sp. YY47 TaxID=2929486 RepID=UPI0020010B54|nr:hypothetical protein [Maribellus sp. YY47]MCK3686162.1 hypothetical protein [Maribellus sp. YY47]
MDSIKKAARSTGYGINDRIKSKHSYLNKNKSARKRDNSKDCIIYGLWMNRDTGMIYMEEVTQLKEKVPFGGHVLKMTGPEEKIKTLLRKLEKNPFLVERYLMN